MIIIIVSLIMIVVFVIIVITILGNICKGGDNYMLPCVGVGGLVVIVMVVVRFAIMKSY